MCVHFCVYTQAHCVELLIHFTPESDKLQGGGRQGVPDLGSLGTEEEKLRGIWDSQETYSMRAAMFICHLLVFLKCVDKI